MFHAARREALGETDAAKPLMASRMTCTMPCRPWLNAGVPAAQVVQWAGHSTGCAVAVYIKCIAGQQGKAKLRIEDAMRPLHSSQTGHGRGISGGS